MKDKKLIDLLKTDDLGQVPDDTGSSLLPKPIADKIIEEITETNILRGLFPKITVPKNARNLTIPVIQYGTSVNVYTVGYGADVTDGRNEQAFTTDAVVLTPRLLVAYLDVIEDDLETAGIDLARYLRKALTKKIAEAEAKAMLTGSYQSGPGAYSRIFNGIYTIASGSSCASTAVTYTDSDNLVDKIADARKNLGVYGNDPSDLVLLCSLTFGNKLRKTDRVYNAQYGLEADVLKRGTLPAIMGIKVFETSYLDGTESGEVALLVRKDAFIIGERKAIWVREKDLVEKFSKRIIIAEEIDFKPQLKNSSDKFEGIVLIHKSS